MVEDRLTKKIVNHWPVGYRDFVRDGSIIETGTEDISLSLK